jgi:hypothetical protein
MALAEEYGDRRVYRPTGDISEVYTPTDELPEPDQLPKGAAGAGSPAPSASSDPSN